MKLFLIDCRTLLLLHFCNIFYHNADTQQITKTIFLTGRRTLYKIDYNPINLATRVLYFMISNKIHESAEAIYSSSRTGRVFSDHDNLRC